MNLTPDLTFLDQTKFDLEFSGSNFIWKLCFLDHEHDQYCHMYERTNNLRSDTLCHMDILDGLFRWSCYSHSHIPRYSR